MSVYGRGNLFSCCAVSRKSVYEQASLDRLPVNKSSSDTNDHHRHWPFGASVPSRRSSHVPVSTSGTRYSARLLCVIISLKDYEVRYGVLWPAARSRYDRSGGMRLSRNRGRPHKICIYLPL